MAIYIGEDPSEIKKLLKTRHTRCIIATKTNTDYAFAVTDNINTKYKELVRELKKKYSPTTYKYVRGSMAVTNTKTDKESGKIKGGKIELNVFKGEDDDALPEDSRLKKMVEVRSMAINENKEIPREYLMELKDNVYEDAESG